jgi:hypothetical protein
MKTRTLKPIWRTLAAAAMGLGILHPAGAAFVYETPNEFLTSGDFNGDGIPDALVLDKLTGNARVGYANTGGSLTWSAPLVTGAPNATGCGVEHFLSTARDSVAVTAPPLNLVNLVDLSQTNAAGTPQAFTENGVGPHAVAGLRAAASSISPGLPFLLVASSFNDGGAENLELGQPGNVHNGTFDESGPFDLANALDIASNQPTLGVGMVRGATNDDLHLWEFDPLPGIVGTFSGLPPGSAYVFGNFNGESLPRFIFYQPGGTNLSAAALTQTNLGYAFGAPQDIVLSNAVENIFFEVNGTNGSAIIQYDGGIQALTFQNGSAVLSSNYQAGAGAAGNVFSGVVPLGNGQFVLLDAPPGASSAHEQVVRFDGKGFTRLSASNLPPVSLHTSRANVWLFQSEPFVNRNPGFVASLNAPDWADGVSGLPGTVQVAIESDAGTNGGLGSVSTNNLGPAPSGAAFGIGNQYHPAISVFGYTAPQAAPAVTVTISPPPGPYGGPTNISFDALPTGSAVQYRAGSADSWHAYTSTFSISNDMTIQYYGISTLGIRGGLELASYTFGNPPTTGTNSPIATIPDNTNTVAVLSTNQLTLSPGGTIFYGRRSAANEGTIWAINLDGSSDTYITTGVRPRVSPDGRWMAFLRDGDPFGNHGNIWLRDLQSGSETRLFNNNDQVVGYDWFADGSALVTDYACGLWRLGTNGVISPVITADCYDDAPVLNPLDGRLAFHNLNPNSGIAGLYVADANGSNVKRILSLPAGASWPAWSPDGSVLALVDGNSSASVDNGVNLWLANPDGTGLVQLSGFSGGSNGFPHGVIWTPDESALVGAGTIFGTNGLWVIPLTPDLTDCDGPPILLPTTPGDAIDFAGSIVAAPGSPLVSAQPPNLLIRQTPDMVVVYWNTNDVGYTLESAEDLAAPAWTSINGPYYLNGDFIEYWQARTNLLTTEFFRLHYTGAVIISPSP